MPLLEIRDLVVEFTTGDSPLRAVDGLNLGIEPRESVALVGESGCGKSVTALSIARLLPSPPARWSRGAILLNGKNVLHMTAGELRQIRGGIVAYVFQDPTASLNPVMRVGGQVMEALRQHRPDRACTDEVIRLLKLVRLPEAETRIRDYPFELSGGMQQRVMLAIALASEPKLLVADEPTTALDVTIQAQILELLQELRRRVGMALLLITHNLPIVRGLVQRVFVMYAGQIVESGATEAVLSTPRHPYTRALIASVPRLGQTSERLAAIEGNVPGPGAVPPGCSFAPRCPIARPQCSSFRPELLESVGRAVRCPFWDQNSCEDDTGPDNP